MMRKINEIIVHCSATAEGNNFTVDNIRQWHKARGFSDVGYHYVVHIDGSVHTGRPEDAVGAHCLGHNKASIGVCYVGGCAADGTTPKDTRTPMQKSALQSLIRRLCLAHPGATVHGHREFAAKACPCFDAASEYKPLEQKADELD